MFKKIGRHGFGLSMLAVMLLFPFAGHAENSQSVTPIPGKKPFVGMAFDTYALAYPRVAELIAYVGLERESRVDAVGATQINRNYVPGESVLVIENQKVGYQLVRAGIAANNMSWVDIGLRAIEWGLRPEVLGEDGSFPDQLHGDSSVGRELHPKSLFLDSAAHTILLVREADLPDEFKVRAEAMVPGLLLAVNLIVQNGDAEKYFRRVGNSSQLAFVAMSIHQAGLIAGDTTLVDFAKAKMEYILSVQYPDGGFLEKGGTDTGYQMNTLELTTAYNATLEPGEWRDTVSLANKKATDWMLSRVRPDGSIDTTGNTRQQACGGSVPGDFPKGLDIDSTPIRLYYYALLAGSIKKIQPVADRIQFRGITYDHIGHCTNRVVE
jgi:hypothetical protein